VPDPAPTAALLLVGAFAALTCARCASSSDEQRAVATLQEGIAAGRAGDLDRAAELFEQAHTERPGFVDPLMFLANVHERRGDVGAARATYRRVLEIDPTLTAAAGALALTYVREGRRNEGRTWFEHCIEADPGFAPALFDLGLLAEQAHAVAEAADWYRLAATMDVRTPAPLVRLGALELAAGRRDAARELARKALDRAPGDPAATQLAAACDGNATPPR